MVAPIIPLKTALVGYGYWGPNILRNLLANPRFQVEFIIDAREERIKEACRIFPGVKSNTDYRNLDESKYDCVFVATPPETHLEVASYFVKKGKHVWIEKPAVTNMQEFQTLKALVKENQVKVFVDHTFVFSPAVRELKKRMDRGEFGSVLHVNSLRVNLGIFQAEVDALFDLAIHDLAIIDYLFPDLSPIWVTNQDFDPFNYGQASISSLVVQYQGGLSASIQVNWISPVKKRDFFVIGQKQAAMYDETDQNQKLKIFQQEFASQSTLENDISNRTMILTSYKTGDVIIPKIQNIEALKIGIDEFYETITENKNHCCEIKSVERIFSILSAAKKSSKSQGARVEL
jgi:predicted dehydrogenase